MNRTNNFCKLLTVTAVLLTWQAKLNAGSFVYEVVPVTMLDTRTGDPYTATGTITTACNDCSLTIADILAYDVQVSGVVPFNFLETNGAVLNLRGAVASPSQLFVVQAGIVVLGSQDNSNPDCLVCVQFMDWNNDVVSYLHFDLADMPPNIGPAVEARFIPPQFFPLVIATIIPEPTGFAFAAFGCLLMTIRRTLRMEGVQRD